jgi:hypothetical protein
MRASIFGIRVDEVMKYSVQSTKLCLGKSDLIIVFFLFPLCRLTKIELSTC